MSATKANSVLETLELDTAIIDTLPEPALSELFGFLEYDGRLHREREETTSLCPSNGEPEK
ncbi:MAG TPA: hypothetical protein VJ783_16630 [Pirellulales bacterium]|nr:hypothetical protein [Pirellulales bacterium]